MTITVEIEGRVQILREKHQETVIDDTTTIGTDDVIVSDGPVSVQVIDD